jgi:ATP-dependent Lhr-like helicase
VPGAYVVLVDWEPVLYVERGGRGLLRVVAERELEQAPGTLSPRLRRALCALASAAREGRTGKLAIERVDGESVLGTPIEGALTELGFSAGPRRLTLRASS